jgi:uncharacterized protein YndB with AHSA1/START domain
MDYVVSVDIEAPLEMVWAALTDIERWPQWTRSIERVERLDNGQFGAGSTARIKQPRMPVVVWRVTELEPERGFTWVAKSPGVTTVGGHRLTPAARGGVTVTLSLRQSGPLAWLVALFTSGMTRRYIQMEASGLKQHSEQAATLTAPRT